MKQLTKSLRLRVRKVNYNPLKWEDANKNSSSSNIEHLYKYCTFLQYNFFLSPILFSGLRRARYNTKDKHLYENLPSVLGRIHNMRHNSL